ncbi:MAG: hypothetical protein F6J94_32710 [Moorea sp. SIO1F2]|uniref:hypothetical protein n=1 Tax=Moorena sp. SIO1F2 TaxID=2607819 RepID=UPI0013BC089A|nr:hypothetical protein [Moorena sp. SIO1F2]NET86442.1 hypothetical protein [Moorena sp. SIO1F2]
MRYAQATPTAVSGQRSVVSGQWSALWDRLWPRYANGHATRMATLREWPRCANDASDLTHKLIADS